MQSTSQQPSTQTSFVDICNVSKKYTSQRVLDKVNLRIGPGEIVGLIGPNGAGKSTLLKAIMGLINCSGTLSVFHQDPFKNRARLLQNMSYIADVACLPEWMAVGDLLQFMTQAHPKFDINRAEHLLHDTPIKSKQKIATLSKGMKTRLHLALILAIETDFLVLDEPTLGLDILVRREFQDRLVKDYYNQQRSILITTHQVNEIESILTRVVFIKKGKITLDLKVSELKTRYSKLITEQGVVVPHQMLTPLYQRTLPEHNELLFEGADNDQLKQYGEVVIPSLEDLFIAINT